MGSRIFSDFMCDFVKVVRCFAAHAADRSMHKRAPVLYDAAAQIYFESVSIFKVCRSASTRVAGGNIEVKRSRPP